MAKLYGTGYMPEDRREPDWDMYCPPDDELDEEEIAWAYEDMPMRDWWEPRT